MAKVTGPLFSMSASGTVGKAITFSTWKGIAYVREYFIPSNPQSTQQTNVRLAMAILVAYWQVFGAPGQLIWNDFASGTGMSGFNQFVKRGLDAYILDHGVDIVPASVTVVGDPPVDVWTWVPVV